MPTDFFVQQDAARRSTGWLVFLFILAVVSIIILTYLLFAFLFLFVDGVSEQQRNYTEFVAPTPGEKPHVAEPQRTLWDWRLFLAVVGGVLLVVGGACALKIAELSSGGQAVAAMLGGVEIPPDTRDQRERRLLNIVEEMSIAAGIPTPPVYLLPEERGINAFAAGYAPGDAVVGISQGCLDYLNRDELQGVVAHEFSHILNGDMRLNIRLIGLIFGIIVLMVIGRILLHASFYSRGGSSRRSDGRGVIVMVAIGLGLLVLGAVGSFFGTLIQAAISRQREYLADASAVQFTRNPQGIAGALKKIGGMHYGSKIQNAHASEVSHMFFSDAFLGSRLSSAFSTHPPLVQRIKKLDPHFDGTFPEVKMLPEAVEQREVKPAKGRPHALPGLPQFPLPVGAILGGAAALHVGEISSRGIDYAHALHESIPQELHEAAHHPFSARALVYCLLLDQEPAMREKQLKILSTGSDPRDFEQTLRLLNKVRVLPPGVRLPLLDLTLPALRQMSPRQHLQFRDQVEQLAAADGKLGVFEYVLRCVLNHHLDEDFGKKRARVRHWDAGKLTPQVVDLLSLLAWEGQNDLPAARKAFNAGMKEYLGRYSDMELLPRDETTLARFDAALKILMQAAPQIKRRVLEACAACILADRQVTATEAELLRAIGDTLDCPIPPLLGEG